MPVSIKYSSFSKEKVPIIKDKQIEKFVNDLLLDYDPNYFKTPHSLDIDSFIEFYLKINLTYHVLSSNDDKNKILGITALTGGKVPIFDEDIDYIVLNKGDICVDDRACKNEHLLRFTLAHEAGHSMMHVNCSFKLSYANDYSNSINYGEPKKLKTVSDWIDHHANVYAACLLMPEKFIKELFLKFYDPNAKMKKAMLNHTVSEISGILNVSPKAVAIRLNRLKLLNDVS